MKQRVSLAHLWHLTPGEVLSTYVNGVEHFGILTDRHLYGLAPSIISASKALGRVADELPLGFAPSGLIFAHGYWGYQSRELTVSIAKSRRGEKYYLFQKNCEHFVRVCQGLPAESPQLAAAFGLAALIGTLFGFAKMAM